MTSLPFAADLRGLYKELAPRTVGCLFTDDLAHLPLDEFLLGGSRVWVVDGSRSRPPRVVASLLSRDEGGQIACRACHDAAGQAMCTRFVAPEHEGARVCANFALADGTPPQCARFEPGSRANFVIADAAMGRRACFTMRVEDMVARSGSPQEALDQALAECQRCSELDRPLDLPSESLDLAISVLVPSRIGDQAFQSLRERLERRFGSRSLPSPSLAQVRAALFRMQLEGHLKELHRLVQKPTGHVYLATEPAAPTRRKDNWSLAPGIPMLFALIHRYFTFDFGRLSPTAFLRHVRGRDGREQVVQAVVLTPRKRTLPAEGPWAAQFEGGES